jgi:hypothetical protein
MLDVAWVGISIYLVFADLVLHDISGQWPLLCGLTALAIFHSAKMTMTLPWLVLRSALFGIMVFVLFWLVKYLSGGSFTPIVVAFIAATGHYLWVGEVWTNEQYRRQALVSFANKHRQQQGSTHGDPTP